MTIHQLSPVNQNWRKPSFINSQGKATFGKNKRKRPTKKIIGTIVAILVLLILIGSIFLLGMLAWVSKDLPNADGVLNRSVVVSSKIYDREGKTVLYDLHGDIKRTIIPLSDIPNYVQKATITAEDRDFYNHKGFSLTGIARSIVKNIFTGSKVGGSTLTQQFVKNAILTNEKTYTRKLKELLISYRLEKNFSKDQILNMYFNEIPYGSVVYGIEAASQTFFGKSAKDLTIAEAAILAAIPQAPTYYSPYGNHKDKLIVRQRYILDSMVDLGYISRDQAETAKKEKITFKPTRESMIAPHFVMYVKELLSEQYGEDFINQEGLKIITTLDLEKQKIAEKAVEDGVKANGTKYGFGNASLVSLDPKTGQIFAMVGSADYFNDKIDGQVNVAIRPRQPGSSFKPIVYAASFIKGYTPDTVVYDVVTNFDTSGSQKYEPHNYNLNENGPVTFRKALAGSLNIPAVKATYLTGINNILDLAEKMGYTTFADRSRFGLSLVLGGGEVKLLEHTESYSVFAQEGVKHDVTPILKIEDKTGKVLSEYKDKTQNVMDAEIARQITDILSDNGARAYIFGASNRLTLPDRPVAAKTGTTNDYHDAWTMGYTPNLVCGVWVGNSDNKAMKKGADGSVIAAPIWNQYMREALKNAPKENFTKPRPVQTEKPVLDGQVGAGSIIKIDTVSGKLATQYTPSSTIKEITNGDVHDILFYVDKDNPRGAQPTNPETDPQYNNWESSVARWAAKNNLGEQYAGAIPTDYDNIHLAEDQPTIEIISPADSSTVKDAILNISVNATAKRGIKKINYYIDDKLEAEKFDVGPAMINISSYENGYHKVTVQVKDDLDNTASKTIYLNFLLSSHTPSMLFLNKPAKATKFPLSLSATIKNWQEAQKIEFYYQNTNEADEHYIGFIEPNSTSASISWKNKPAIGQYKVFANIIDNNGREFPSDNFILTIE
ncbi:MAG: PBP1A family penicillin-binding protein [Candidatus Buchananbacteria bacterium]